MGTGMMEWNGFYVIASDVHTQIDNSATMMIGIISPHFINFT